MTPLDEVIKALPETGAQFIHQDGKPAGVLLSYDEYRDLVNAIDCGNDCDGIDGPAGHMPRCRIHCKHVGGSHPQKDGDTP